MEWNPGGSSFHKWAAPTEKDVLPYVLVLYRPTFWRSKYAFKWNISNLFSFNSRFYLLKQISQKMKMSRRLLMKQLKIFPNWTCWWVEQFVISQLLEGHPGLAVKVLDSKGHGFDSRHWHVCLQPWASCFTLDCFPPPRSNWVPEAAGEVSCHGPASYPGGVTPSA